MVIQQSYEKLDLKAVPSVFTRVIDEASMICKRIDANLIDSANILAAIVKLYPDLSVALQADLAPDVAQQSILRSLKANRQRVSGSGTFITNEAMKALREASASKGSTAEILQRFIEMTRNVLPEHFGTETPISPTESKKTPDSSTDDHSPSGQPGKAPAESDPASRSSDEKKQSEASPKHVRIPFTIPWNLGRFTETSENLVGRETFIARLLPVIIRKTDPAVMILGEPGCGKTAILRGLVKGVLEGKYKTLNTFSFAELDSHALLAGIAQRAFGPEILVETLQKVAAQNDLVLLVDDLELFVGQCGRPMIDDLVACFKLFLYGGRLRVLFTATPKVFESTFSQDRLFADHITPLYLEELSGEHLIDAVHESQKTLPAYYSMNVGTDALQATIQMSSDRQLPYRPPGSCRRLIDNACAVAVLSEDRVVTSDHVEKAVGNLSDSMFIFEKGRLRSIENTLKKFVQGQDDAVNIVAQRIRLTKLQLDRKPNRPDGVFLFLGPSGVGKTELAKAVTTSLYEGTNRLVRIDMSEFMSQHEYSKLIGSPPGYVGFGEEGHLTGPVARLGHTVILLDEIEKAHSSVLNLFLQIFDEGFVTDGKGKRVDFSRCVIIMTSNLGKELFEKEGDRIGFFQPSKNRDARPKPVLDYLLRILPSEFINRIDDIVLFQPLSESHIRHISQRMLDDEIERWKARGKNVSYNRDLVKYLAEKGYNPDLGARHLMRNLEKMVCQTLSEAACQDDWEKIKTIYIDYDISQGKTVLKTNMTG